MNPTHHSSPDTGEHESSLRRRLDQKVRQLQAIGEISAALAAAWELSATLEVITRITSEVMGVASCSIYLLDETGERLVLKATTGLARSAIGNASLRTGEGLTGWVVTHGRPLSIPDVRADSRFKLLPETREEGLHSLLAVPLAVQGRTIGAMNVQTAEPHPYAADGVELLSMIGNLAAGALEKAMLYDRMRSQLREFEGLAQVSRTIISPLYLDEMLGVVAEMTARVMGAKAVVLHLLEEASGRLVLRATHSTDVAHRTAPSFALGEGIVGEVAQAARPLAVADTRADPRFRNAAVAMGEGIVSLLSVPLAVRGRIVGVLTCCTDTPHEFSPKEIDLFSMLANQTALAIENARLVISSAIVREMHHRVKNNLQNVAMLLRLRLGGAPDEPTRAILGDAMAQILSIAAVHETMSEQGLEQVDIKQVLERIARNAGDLTAGRTIAIEVQGDALTLPSRTATSLALTTAELVQNALKHAFVGREQGRVTIRVEAGREQHQVSVADDGIGNPASRPVHQGLGLDIVRTLVTQDLKGRFELVFSPEGTQAAIHFPATPPEGATP